jgi:hypothetical protein
MQDYTGSIFSNLTQGEMIQAVSIILILAYLIFNFTKKK